AGHGADVADVQGAVTSERRDNELPVWLPRVETGAEQSHWRRIWLYELESDSVRPVSSAAGNPWEAAWCGSEAIAAVMSDGPSESSWYRARLRIISLDADRFREVYVPKEQLGWPAASPCGRHVAVVESIASDRCLVAGELRLVDALSGSVLQVDTQGVDITCTEWQSDRHLLLAGHRGFESVIGVFDVEAGRFTVVWRSSDITPCGYFASISGARCPGDCVFVGEGFVRAPEIARICRGEYQRIKSFDLGGAESVQSLSAVEKVTWKAGDGLDLQGLLLRPKHDGARPLVMWIHGGPVSHWRPFWLGRKHVVMLMLLQRGVAIFLPNPRGSTARGQDFIRPVLGDMGGADTRDYLSGLDYLIDNGIGDPARLGVTGISYGGYMSAWLITQDARFAAAVPVSPITNHVTEHLLSNIPDFVALFLADHYRNPQGKYFERSPIMHAHKAKTPTLSICGALDRCTPPEEAAQFHNALLENGVESVLVTYPQEGHGVRKFPALIDYTARVVGWFEEHL